MKKQARTGLEREMAQKRFDFLMENTGTKAWMFEQSDGLWTVAWITADPGNVASHRVIQANGGVLVERFHQAAPGAGETLRWRIALASTEHAS